jgi:hypothetical protein
MKGAAAKKPKSEAELIHQVTCNFLKAVKRKNGSNKAAKAGSLEQSMHYAALIPRCHKSK